MKLCASVADTSVRTLLPRRFNPPTRLGRLSAWLLSLFVFALVVAQTSLATITALPVFESLPPAKPANDIWIEGEAYASQSGGGIVAESSCYAGNEWVLYTATAPGSGGYYVQYTVNVPTAGTYNLRVAGQPIGTTWTSPVQVSVDGGTAVNLTSSAASLTGWGQSTALRWTDLGVYTLSAGNHTLRFTVTQLSGTARYAYAIDAIALARVGRTINVVKDNDTTPTNANNLAVVSDSTASISYTIKNEASTTLSSGTLNVSGGSVILPLSQGVGWYDVTLQDSSTTTTSSFSIVRSPRPAQATSGVSTDAALAWLDTFVSPMPKDQFQSTVSEIMGQTSLGWVRDRFNWGQIYPAVNNFNFINYDPPLDKQSAQGVNILIAHNAAPSTITDPTNPNTGILPASLWETYKWGRTIASHTAGRVQAFEFSNEPDLSVKMPLDQVAMHQQAYYLGIKDGNPNATVLTSPLGYVNTGKALQFLRALRSRGFDVFSYHWYPPTNNSNSTQGSFYMLRDFPNFAATVRGWVNDHPIWVTESGYKGAAQTTPTDELSAADELGQAEYASKLATMGPVMGIERLFNFILTFYPETNSGGIRTQYGLIRKTNSNPRPAISALANAADLLNGVSYKGPFSANSSTVTGYIFSRDDNTSFPGSGSSYVMVIWATSAQASYTLPSGVTISSVRDYLGRAVTAGTNTLPLATTPRFVLFTNNNISNSIGTAPAAQIMATDSTPSRVVMRWSFPGPTTVDKTNGTAGGANGHEQYVVNPGSSTTVALEIVNLGTTAYTATIEPRLSNSRWVLTPPAGGTTVTVPARPTNLLSTSPTNRVLLNFTLAAPSTYDSVQLQAQANFDGKVVRATETAASTNGDQSTVGSSTNGGILLDATQPSQNIYGFDDAYSWQFKTDGTGNYLTALASSPTLLAGWTFNDQVSQSAALTADLGTLAGQASFTPGVGGSGATLTLNGDGTVTLSPGEFLHATAINSTAYPDLKDGVTIVAWLTSQGAPATNNNSALYGLTGVTPPATGSAFPGSTGLGALGFQVLNSNGSTTAPTARAITTLSDGVTQAGTATSSYNTLPIGSAARTAVSFSSTGSSYTLIDQVGTTTNTRTATSTLKLANFNGLGIGRLNAGTTNYGTGLVVNEIAVYKGALTQSQVSALNPSSRSLAIPGDQFVRAPFVSYRVNFPTAGTYNVWIDARTGGGGTTGAVHVGLNDLAQSTAMNVAVTSTSWGWVNLTSSGSAAKITVPAGRHTVNVWAARPGTQIRQIFLTTSNTPTLPPSAMSAYQSWRYANFSSSQLNNSAVSGDTATPADDNISNRLKYALQQIPLKASSSQLPSTGIVKVADSRYLALTYRQNIFATDVSYVAEVSDDLQTWSSGDGYTSIVKEQADVGDVKLVTVRDMTPLASAGKRFIRLAVR